MNAAWWLSQTVVERYWGLLDHGGTVRIRIDVQQRRDSHAYCIPRDALNGGL